MKNTSLLLATVLGLASAAVLPAASQSFDFKDPKGVNNVQFKLDAPLESITGTATGISGTIAFDPSAPEATTGKIVLDTTTLAVGNPLMGEHLHGAYWLDVATYPSISFEAEKVANVRTEGAKVLADVTGKLSIKDVTKEVTVPVTFTYLPGKLGARLGDDKIKGDLLVLRATFSINREEFNIQPGAYTDKVATDIQLSLSIAGAVRHE